MFLFLLQLDELKELVNLKDIDNGEYEVKLLGQTKLKNMFLVLLPGHYCQVITHTHARTHTHTHNTHIHAHTRTHKMYVIKYKNHFTVQID